MTIPDFIEKAGRPVKLAKWVNQVGIDDIPVFFDTEFSRLGYKGESFQSWGRSVELLSLGLAPYGLDSSFYLSRKLTSDVLEKCSGFAHEHVIPYLECGIDVPNHARLHGVQLEDMGKLGNEYLADIAQTTGKNPIICVDFLGEGILCKKIGIETPLFLITGVHGWEKLSEREQQAQGLVAHHARDDAVAMRIAHQRWVESQSRSS